MTNNQITEAINKIIEKVEYSHEQSCLINEEFCPAADYATPIWDFFKTHNLSMDEYRASLSPEASFEFYVLTF